MEIIVLIKKSRFKSVKNVARFLKIDHSNLFNYLAKRYHKIGKAKRKLIREFFQQQNWIPTPPPKEKCTCEKCGRVHIKKKVKVVPAQCTQ